MRNDDLYRIVRDSIAEKYRELHRLTAGDNDTGEYAGTDLLKFVLRELHNRYLTTEDCDDDLEIAATQFLASMIRGLGSLPLQEQVRVIVYGMVGELTDFDQAMGLPEDWQVIWPDQIYAYLVARDIAKRSTIESIPQWVRGGFFLTNGYVELEDI